MAKQLRVLFFDVETAPLLAYVWQAKVEYVNYGMLEVDSFFLSWSAKWRGESKVLSDVLTSEEAMLQDDSRIVQSLADLVREADIIVAHNGDAFDIPKLNARLVLLQQEPLGPKQSIDTKTLSSRAFRLAYNKLDYLAEKLLGEGKIETDFDLWRDCYYGDEKALKQMLKYNKKDVILLERIFEKLLPYVKNLPRLVEPETKDEVACPFCGANHYQARGYKRTSAASYRQFHCLECKRYFRFAKAEPAKLLTRPL